MLQGRNLDHDKWDIVQNRKFLSSPNKETKVKGVSSIHKIMLFNAIIKVIEISRLKQIKWCPFPSFLQLLKIENGRYNEILYKLASVSLNSAWFLVSFAFFFTLRCRMLWTFLWGAWAHVQHYSFHTSHIESSCPRKNKRARTWESWKVDSV